MFVRSLKLSKTFLSLNPFLTTANFSLVSFNFYTSPHSTLFHPKSEEPNRDPWGPRLRPHSSTLILSLRLPYFGPGKRKGDCIRLVCRWVPPLNVKLVYIVSLENVCPNHLEDPFFDSDNRITEIWCKNTPPFFFFSCCYRSWYFQYLEIWCPGMSHGSSK